MPLAIAHIHHINITVPTEKIAECVQFYTHVLGLPQVEPPENIQALGGAWFRTPLENDGFELHLSPCDNETDKAATRSHICYLVDDLRGAETLIADHGIEISPDRHPIAGYKRFYLRDPGGNRLELIQKIV